MQKKLASEIILDGLASGKSFKDLQKTHGFSKKDLITAALFGVAELQEELFDLIGKRPPK